MKSVLIQYEGERAVRGFTTDLRMNLDKGKSQC